MAVDASSTDTGENSDASDAPSDGTAPPTSADDVPSETSYEKKWRLNIESNASKLRELDLSVVCTSQKSGLSSERSPTKKSAGRDSQRRPAPRRQRPPSPSSPYVHWVSSSLGPTRRPPLLML
jgi:hypothetical protein